MSLERQESQDPIERKLEVALEVAEESSTRYHLREALQLRIVEKDAADRR